MYRVLSREGADAWTLGRIYVAVVQVVMIYGSEKWVTTPHIGRVLGGFHHRVDHRLTGRQTQRGRDGGWVYTPMEDAMEEAGLLEVENYVSRHQNTVTQFIATRTILDLCLVEERRMGSRVANWWWEQDGLNLEEMRTASWEAERMDVEEETDWTEMETD